MNTFNTNEYLYDVRDSIYPDWARGERFMYSEPIKLHSLNVSNSGTSFWSKFIHIFS